MGRRFLLPLVSLAAVLVLAASGCGGDDSASAAEAWADSFCTSIASWNGSLELAGDTFRDAGGLTPESIRTALDDITEATRQFAREVEELGPPETEASAEIEAELETLADDLGDSADELQGILDAEATSVAEALQNVSQVTDVLADMSAAIGGTFESISRLDPDGTLSDAVEATDSCSTLTSGS